MSVNYRRQTALFNPENHADRHVTIIGTGNIGSHTARAITQLGIKNITIYDDDIVEAHNLSSQAYHVSDIGDKKVLCLERQLKALNPDVNVEIKDTFYVDDVVPDILISAVDSMITRKNIAKAILEHNTNTFIIDGRMGGGQIEVHSQHISKWLDTMSDNPDTDPCSARFISYTSYIIAGYITNNLKRHLENQNVPSRILFHCDTYQLFTEYEKQID